MDRLLDARNRVERIFQADQMKKESIFVLGHLSKLVVDALDCVIEQKPFQSLYLDNAYTTVIKSIERTLLSNKSLNPGFLDFAYSLIVLFKEMEGTSIVGQNSSLIPTNESRLKTYVDRSVLINGPNGIFKLEEDCTDPIVGAKSEELIDDKEIIVKEEKIDEFENMCQNNNASNTVSDEEFEKVVAVNDETVAVGEDDGEVAEVGVDNVRWNHSIESKAAPLAKPAGRIRQAMTKAVTSCPAKSGSTLTQLGTVNRPLITEFKMQCDHCDYSSVSTMTMHGHIRSIHPDHFARHSHACCSCDFRTMDASLLRAHQQWFFCTLCCVEVSLCEKTKHDGSVNRKLAVKRRLEETFLGFQCKCLLSKGEIHKSEMCPICKQRIPTCISLEDHWNRRLGEEFACMQKCSTNAVCDFRSRNMTRLQTHENSHSTLLIVHDFDIRAKCPYCPEHIDTALEFNDHMFEYHTQILSRYVVVLKCNGENLTTNAPCTFKASRICHMIAHWEENSHTHFRPSLCFDYEAAQKVRYTAGE